MLDSIFSLARIIAIPMNPQNVRREPTDRRLDANTNIK